MTFSDPIADFLTRIRNSARAKHRYVDISWSKMKQSLADILKNMGFIENYLVKVENHQGVMRIFLKYTDGRHPVISGLTRVSKPGLRRYVEHHNIPHFHGGLGVAILSTSKGVMQGQEARKLKIGGELLCLVW